MSNVIIFWNPTEYANLLSKSGGENNIITSEKEALITINRQDITGLIILSELNWGDHKLSQLYGVEFAKRVIRAQHRLRTPILFVSFMPPEEILRDPRAQIVVSVGHDFLQLPTHHDEWKKKLGEIQPLTELQLVDVINNLCNLEGIIDEIIHGVQSRSRSIIASRGKMDSKSLVTELEDGIDEVVALLANSASKVRKQDILQRFRLEITDSGRLDDTVNFLARAAEEFKSLIDTEGEPAEVIKATSVRLPWRVLVLDDEPESISSVLDALVQRGMAPLVVQDVREAEKIIEEDIYNRIVVAISDYRLYEKVDGIRKQQPRQGYDFIFNLSQADRFTGLIALSGLNRRFLLESFRRFSTRVAVYSKYDLSTPPASSLFADAVLDLASHTFEALCSQPQGGDWDNLKRFYIAHRNSHDFEISERTVAKRARDYVLQIESVLLSNDYELILSLPVPYLKDLQAKMAKKDPYNPAHMEIFRNKLIARRIALWFYFTKRFGAINIYAVLNRTLDVSAMLNRIESEVIKQTDPLSFDLRIIEKKAKENLENKAKSLVNTYLSLSLSDFPSGILLEEKHWFKYNMSVDIYDLEEFLTQITCHLQIALRRWSSKNLKIANALSQRAELVTKDGVPVITSMKHARFLLSLINKCISTSEERLEFKELLKSIEEKISSDAYCRKYLDPFRRYINELVQ